MIGYDVIFIVFFPLLSHEWCTSQHGILSGKKMFHFMPSKMNDFSMSFSSLQIDGHVLKKNQGGLWLIYWCIQISLDYLVRTQEAKSLYGVCCMYYSRLDVYSLHNSYVVSVLPFD
jgi:hypothetical protein